LRTLAILTFLVSCSPLHSQKYIVISSELDSTQSYTPQAVSVFDSVSAMTKTLESPSYSGHLFSHFSFDGKQWLAISQLNDSVSTEMLISETRPSAMIKDMWKDKMEITDIAFGQGHWIVYARTNSGVQQVMAHTTEFNKIPELIQERWAEGYVVTHATYGQGAWALLFSKPLNEEHPLNGVAQVYSTIAGSYEEIQLKVESRWKQGYAITSIASSGNLWLIIGTRWPGIVSQQIVMAKSRDELLEVMYLLRQDRLVLTELVALP